MVLTWESIALVDVQRQQPSSGRHQQEQEESPREPHPVQLVQQHLQWRKNKMKPICLRILGIFTPEQIWKSQTLAKSLWRFKAVKARGVPWNVKLFANVCILQWDSGQRLPWVKKKKMRKWNCSWQQHALPGIWACIASNLKHSVPPLAPGLSWGRMTNQVYYGVIKTKIIWFYISCFNIFIPQNVQYIPWNMHMIGALFFLMWLGAGWFYPYPSELLHWQTGTIIWWLLVPLKQWVSD